MEPLRGKNTCIDIKKNKEKYFRAKIPLTLNFSKAFLNLIFALSNLYVYTCIMFIKITLVQHDAPCNQTFKALRR